jgi:hypothetical protein
LRARLDPGALACKLLNAFASTSPPAELVVLLGALTAGQGINSLTPPLKNRQRRLAGRSIRAIAFEKSTGPKKHSCDF